MAEMLAKSDLVAVIRLVSTRPSDEKLTTADPPSWLDTRTKYGKRDPIKYRGYYATASVASALKGEPAEEITILLFAYVGGPLEFNGGLFMEFLEPGIKVKGVEVSNRDEIVPILPMPLEFLAYLKRRDDGVYVPVSGNYDAAPSFRLLSWPPTTGVTRLERLQLRKEGD